MSTNVVMPQLGESVVEGTIAKWLVAEGDRVQEDQALVEVTTDKIDTEIPSPAAGVIGRLLVSEGQTVAIGTVLCEISPAGAPAERAPAAPAPPARTAGAREGEVAREPAMSQAGASAARPPSAVPRREIAARPREPERAQPAAPASPTGREPGAPASRRAASAQPGVALDPERAAAAAERRSAGPRSRGNGDQPVQAPRVTPVVRKMAAERGLDLADVAGTGVGGRITKQDLLLHLELEPAEGEASTYGDLLGLESPAAAVPPAPAGKGARAVPLTAETVGRAPRGDGRGERAAGPAAAGGMALREYSPPDVQPGDGDRVEPFSKRRRIIAEHMVYSKAVSPHVYTMAEVDMHRVAALREAKKRAFREEGLSLTYLHFVIAAAVRALRDVPRMNAAVADDALIFRRDVNVGVAVETEQGLVVPVLKQADRLSLRGIAREVDALAAKARDRKLRLEDLQGGTFTVSNPGREGNLVGFAILNQPQLGILRMGEIKKRPVVVEVDGADAIVIRPVMLMALSYDHRVIDGVTGNAFLYRAKEHLEAGEFDA